MEGASQLRRHSSDFAVRSLKSMSFGGFQDRSDCDEIQLDFPSQIIQEIVKYCYTGKVDENLINHTNESAKAFIQLHSALIYFGFPGILILETSNLFDEACACAVVEALAIRRGIAEAPGLLKPLVNHPESTLFPDDSECNAGIRGLPFYLPKIFLTKCDLNAATAVKALQTSNTKNEPATDKERAALQKLAYGIDLESLNMDQLPYTHVFFFFTVPAAQSNGSSVSYQNRTPC